MSQLDDVNTRELPDGLKGHQHWVMTRSWIAGGKAPVTVDGERGELDQAGWSDRRDDWMEYDEAVRTAQEHGCDGLGYALVPEKPVICIDYDNFRDPETGELDAIFKALPKLGTDTYTELSTSGTGAHKIYTGFLPSWARGKSIEFEGTDFHIDVFPTKDGARHLKLTGDHVEGCPEDVEHIEYGEIEDWLRTVCDIAGMAPWDDDKKPEVSTGDSGNNTNTPDLNGDDDVPELKASDVFPGIDVGKNAEHPIHGSSTGTNFKIDEDEKTWRCWRHDCTGNAYHLLGMDEGIIDCGDWDNTDLSSNQWGEIFNAARDRGLIPETDLDPRTETPNEASEPLKSTTEEVAPDGGAVSHPVTPETSAQWSPIRTGIAEGNTRKALHKAAIELGDSYHPTRTRTGKRAQGHYYDTETGMYKEGASNVLADAIFNGLDEWYELRHERKVINGAFAHVGSVDEIPTREDGLLLLENGILDVEAVLNSDGDGLPDAEDVLLPKTHEKMFTSRVPRSYDPDAECPEFDEFLEQTVPDDNERERLLEHLGASLIHWRVPKDFAVIVGPGNSGKTTLTNILHDVLDADGESDNTFTRSIHDLAGGDFGLAGLQRALMVTASELGNGGSGAAEFMKRLHGGEGKVPVEEKYKNVADEKVAARFLYVSNRLPYFPDADRQFYERAVITHAPNSVPVGNQDKLLAERIVENEADGIIAMLLRHACQYSQNGYKFTTPVDPEDARDEWEKWSNSVNRFLETAIEGTPGTGSHAVLTSELYDVYAQYCRNEMVEPTDKDKFGAILSNKGVHKDRAYWDGDREYVYHGLEFNEEFLDVVGYETSPVGNGLSKISGRDRVKTGLIPAEEDDDGDEWVEVAVDSESTTQTELSESHHDGESEDDGGDEGGEIDHSAKESVVLAVREVNRKIPRTSLKGKIGREYDMNPDTAEKAIRAAVGDGLVVESPGGYIESV